MFVAVSPVYAIGIGMALNFLPLMVGAVLAALGRAAYRQLPLWYGLAILPACVAAHSTQATSWLSHGEVRPLYERPLPVCRLSDGGAAGLLVVGPTRLLGLTFAPLCSAASMSFAQLAGRVAHERRTTHAPALHADLTRVVGFGMSLTKVCSGGRARSSALFRHAQAAPAAQGGRDRRTTSSPRQ